MRNILATKIIRFVMTIILITITQMSLANPAKTILETSINWTDEDNKKILLSSAPVWDNKMIEHLFEIYRHPEKYQLPALSNAKNYNIQFINAFWGPLNNPFNKYLRPAKIFIFLNQSGQHFYMAPLIKNSSDQNYYIFDIAQSKPQLLNDWVSDIIHANHSAIIRMNICTNYGSLPTDPCTDKSYQHEANSIDESNNNECLRFTIKNISAHRALNEDWHKKITLHSNSNNSSIYSSGVSWENSNSRNKLLDTVVSWPTYKTIQANFEKLRDIRYFSDGEKPNFSRRISWLYPDDGCWTRASAVIRDLFGPLNNDIHDSLRPSKVFVFGNLCVNTNNSEEGAVSWWYHTAPIIKDASTNQTYVLDPAVNPYKPLTMENWVTEITSTSGACADSNSHVATFSICNGYGANPYDKCKTEYSGETANMLLQSGYLKEERHRQIELGRDADTVLGNQPPWLNNG